MSQRDDIIGARMQPPGVPNYGAHEGYPVRWLDDEAWWLDDNGEWRECSTVAFLAEIHFTAHWLSKHVFDEEFGDLPPLPAAAFVRH